MIRAQGHKEWKRAQGHNIFQNSIKENIWEVHVKAFPINTNCVSTFAEMHFDILLSFVTLVCSCVHFQDCLRAVSDRKPSLTPESWKPCMCAWNTQSCKTSSKMFYCIQTLIRCYCWLAAWTLWSKILLLSLINISRIQHGFDVLQETVS